MICVVNWREGWSVTDNDLFALNTLNTPYLHNGSSQLSWILVGSILLTLHLGKQWHRIVTLVVPELWVICRRDNRIHTLHHRAVSTEDYDIA